MDPVAHLNSFLQGRYRVEREIGAGGMARVYLALDLRHSREVAVKVLKAEFGVVLGAERFLREINVMAGLNHPHLLPLFDSGQVDGLLFYVMPYVEGESLRTRILRDRQLPVDEAVRITIAVARALDYAHRRGIVHRDLKPENILMHDGQPQVADFGIALAMSRAGTERITQTGLAIGTPQYASPEQASADHTIDGRSDIYSLGAVLYEMLTADPPHTASTLQGIIARLMTDRPKDIRSLRTSVPEHVVLAVERALEKLPADRFSTAQEFADMLTGGAQLTPSRALPVPVRSSMVAQRVRDPLVLTFGAIALASLGATVWQSTKLANASGGPLIRSHLEVDLDQSIASGELGTPFAISADGAQMVYLISKRGQAPRLFLRRFVESEGSEVANTEGALHPTFAPDGESIAFVVANTLKILRLGGGSPKPRELGPQLGTVFGASWGRDDRVIVGAEVGGLISVPIDGGNPTILTTPDTANGEVSHRWPVVLDDGETVLYTSWRGATETARIGVASLSEGTLRTLDLIGTFPLGVAKGQLVYADTLGWIVAVPFDVGGRRVTGSSKRRELGQVSVAGAEKAALSTSGTLIYQQLQSSVRDLVSVDAKGEVRALLPTAERFADPRISPLGTQLAVTVYSDSGPAVFVYPLPSGPPLRLGVGGAKTSRPEWTRDGRALIYRSEQNGGIELWRQAADGQTPVRLIAQDVQAAEGVPTRDDKAIIYRGDSESRSGPNIWWRSFAGDTVPKPVFASPRMQTSPSLAPAGDWVAFTSNMSGNFEVYAAPFPGRGSACLVSQGGGTEPAWSSDGQRIFYRYGAALIVATLRSLAKCDIASRDRLFELPLHSDQFHRQFDVLPSGAGFVALREHGHRSDVQIVHNWLADARATRGGRR